MCHLGGPIGFVADEHTWKLRRGLVERREPERQTIEGRPASEVEDEHGASGHRRDARRDVHVARRARELPRVDPVARATCFEELGAAAHAVAAEACGGVARRVGGGRGAGRAGGGIGVHVADQCALARPRISEDKHRE